MSIYDKWFTDMTKAACEIIFHDSSVTAVDYDSNAQFCALNMELFYIQD